MKGKEWKRFYFSPSKEEKGRKNFQKEAVCKLAKQCQQVLLGNPDSFREQRWLFDGALTKCFTDSRC